MAITFVRSNGRFYWLNDGNTISTKIGYLLANGVTAPDTLSLADSWQVYAGCYIFLNSPITKLANFTLAAQLYLDKPQRSNVRFVWFYNPNEPTLVLQGESISVYQTNNYNSVKEIKIFDLNNFSFLLGKDCTINFNANQPWLEFTAPDNHRNYLMTRRGGQRLYSIKSAYRLPFNGSKAGCLQCGLTLTEADLDQLDIGLRLFIDKPDYPNWGYLDSYRYPLFHLGNTAINLWASFDPLAPLDEARTGFWFWDEYLGQNITGLAEINSYFRTNLGQEVKLIPQANACLNWAMRPVGQQPDQADNCYLVPSQSFEIKAQNSTALPGEPFGRIMCGISGVEYIGMMNPTSNQLLFFPGQNAYAASYQADNTVNNDTLVTADAPLLTNIATTSWVYALPPTGSLINYYAQPNDYTLYQMDIKQLEFLNYLEISAGTLPPSVMTTTISDSQGHTQQAPIVFPLLPYAGIKSPTLVDYYQLELQVLNPTRRTIIYNLVEQAKQTMPVPPPSTTEHTGTTPQGLLAVFDGSLQYWKRLTLAQTSQGSKLFQLGNITGQLKGALQTNQLFLVISSRDKFLQVCAVLSAELNIHDWNFVLNPAKWSDHNTIMLFKFHSKSIKELSNHATSWLGAKEFNDDPDDIQIQLQNIIDTATEKSKTEVNFDYFVQQVVMDKSWNGILLLRCPVALPPQIEGLAAGLDPQQFYTHHLGINLNPINYEQTPPSPGLVMHDSSLFGLIDYQDDFDLADLTSDYQFKVKSLKVLFQNSDITSFASQIELMANKFFSEPVTLQNSAINNNLLLNGILQKHDGHDSYLFIKQGDDIFQFTSHVLDQVEILKAQFITIVPESTLKPGDKMHSRFIFWGNLRFLQQLGFDLFSFGGLYDDKGHETFTGGLNFANLAIDMAFDPQMPLAKTFTFDASQVAFDLSQSLARPKSLFNHFPIKLKALYQATEEITPANLDYTSVDAPLGQTALSYPWFGLVFEINLGSMGALAGQGSFTANLLAAWSPNTNDSSIFIGIKLPGMNNGQKEFSLQGILKLAISNIAFTVNDTNYLMRFNDIALKVFSVSLPRYGQTNMLLFGDPEGQDRDTLGWYAAYVNK